MTQQHARYMVAGGRLDGSSEWRHMDLAEEVKQSLEKCVGEGCELDFTYAFAPDGEPEPYSPSSRSTDSERSADEVQSTSHGGSEADAHEVTPGLRSTL
jgi:hypothetical protein